MSRNTSYVLIVLLNAASLMGAVLLFATGN
jgi:hypothetical protein